MLRFYFRKLIPNAFRFNIVDMPDMDVFGSANTKKAVDCTCPNCDRPVASSRFAPHLEKCMGKILIENLKINLESIIETSD